MNFDDACQPMIWRKRTECKKMNHLEIVEAMVIEAKTEGYEPMDLNWLGTPNIYLRGRYSYDTDDLFAEKTWIEDGFVLFVGKKDG